MAADRHDEELRRDPLLVIVGASSGIGEALRRHFAAECRLVVGTYARNKVEGLYPLHSDASGDLVAFGDYCKQLAGPRPITLVHCAGKAVDGFGHKLSHIAFDEALNHNLRSAFKLASTLLPVMRDKQWGRIIFLGSVVPTLGIMGTSAYAAAKAGLWGLTKVLSSENAERGVTVNCLDLGYFDLGMGARLSVNNKSMAISAIPMKRLGTVEPIAAAVEFLEKCDYITGERIRIAGGL